FARKPIFGYPFMVFSGIAIGFMGWGVWAHHMFASGIGPLSVAAFSVSTMFIAVPTGVKIFNWLATIWGGRLRFSAPMLYSLGLVTMFTIGGLSGVTHAVASHDTQQTDTYYIVAHFHYVLFGGALFGFVGAWYYFWPKVFGFFLSDRHGKINFWILLLGFNLTFGPMHILGLQGMPRRTYTYRNEYGFNFWNAVATLGAFIIAASFLYFFWNIFVSYRRHKADPQPIPADPWDGRSLEWTIASPAPAHNFDVAPTVHRFDDFWHRKYRETADGRLIKVREADEIVQPGNPEGVHLPSPSYWPIVLSAGMPFIAWGLIFNLWLCLVGGVLVVAALWGWVLEPSTAPEAGHAPEEGPSGDGGDDAGSAAAVEAPDGEEAAEAETEEAVPVD
ncbi:MAG: cytochrome c oxidase subunit 4, partial [Acidimicrobiales bacterium]|nr:cytochrome c oxidase subunit 4 [Acidimicrobiales bacterium]